jgi:acyl-CoA synthetase (AMP-forming)/AMP-acid ligase II
MPLNTSSIAMLPQAGEGKQPFCLRTRRLPIANLMENVNRVANGLIELGVGMESRVMLLLRDTPEMIYSFYGAIKTGAVPVPTNILMKAPDFLYMLNDSRAPVLIVDAVFLPEIEKILDQAVFLKNVVVCGEQDHNIFRLINYLQSWNGFQGSTDNLRRCGLLAVQRPKP